jgi:hypothetical protein
MKFWVARDLGGQLYFYSTIKPWRESDGSYERPNYWMNGGYNAAIDECLFPEVTWDSDPVEVELKVVEKDV